jgi:putative ABC transport system permease protein
MQFTELRFNVRFLWKNKFFTALNIFGLTLGLAASIWLMLYLKNELTYDQNYINHETVYRISGTMEAPGVKFNTASAAREIAPMLADEYPEVLAYTRFIPAELTELKFNNNVIAEPLIYYTDTQAFELFDHLFIEGNIKTALISPKSAVITKSINTKVFGGKSGLNQIVNIDGNDVKITGIIEDLPKNTHFKYNVLLTGINQRGWFVQDGVFNSEAM